MYIGEELATYVAALSLAEVPEEVVAKIKACLIDTLGCGLGGIATERGNILLKAAELESPLDEAVLLGRNVRIQYRDAAYINALLINSLDFDDWNIGHPGAVVFPVALAVAEKENVSGKTFLEAMICGYEVTCRIGASIMPHIKRDKLFGIGTWQTIGGVVAAGKIIGLSAAKLASAIGIAAANAPVPSLMKTVYNRDGIKHDMVKNNYGTAANVAIRAAYLADGGFRGPRDVFEGNAGFWRMCGVEQWTPDVILEDIHNSFLCKHINMKSYPGCAAIQSTLSAVDGIISENNLLTDMIESVTVSTIPRCCGEPFSSRDIESEAEAQFSLPYAIAALISGRRPGPEWFQDATMRDPAMFQLMKLVQLNADPRADAVVSSKGIIPSEVVIRTVEGTYEGKASTALGDHLNPFNVVQLVSKFSELASHAGWSPSKQQIVIEQLQHIEDAESTRSVTDTFLSCP